MRLQTQFWKTIRGCSFLVFCLAGLSVVSPVFAGECPDDPADIEDAADCEKCNIDLNDDGRATTTDLLIVRRCVAGACGDPRYDANGDGAVTEKDTLTILNCMKVSRFKQK